MTAAGKQPRQIIRVLRQRNPNLVTYSRNVYNDKAKIHKEILAGTVASEPVVLNGVTVMDPAHTYLETNFVRETKGLVSELCRHFYTLGWVSGTGGSITIKVHDDSIPRTRQLIVMSPSGVQKERMIPEDMYVLSADGCMLSTPLIRPYPYNPPKCTDCAPLFLKAYEMRNSGAVIHSHGMEACLVTMIHPLSKEFRITHMEMIKGIQGHGYHDELVVPIIENTAHEGELMESLTEAIVAYPKTTAVLVRNHGVFIWGDSWISAKTQAECYHYLFDAAIKLHQLGLDCSTPGHGPIRNNRVCGCGGNMSRALKRGTFGLDYAIEPSQRSILLDIEGTTTPISFVTDILFPTNNNVVKHFAGSYYSEATQEDISLLRSQDHIWRSGFQCNELVSVVFDDVPEILERWYALGIKVYIYSSGSREAQQLLFGNSSYGDLRKYICGYFDTTVGSKTEAQSYLEILQTVGVDRPEEMLFVTSVFQEAVAASAVGLEVAISIRPGNGPLPENLGFRTIESLLELSTMIYIPDTIM